MTTKRIAFATYSNAPELVADDLAAVAALEALGARVHAAVWDDPTVHWGAFDAVVVRSCWDYHLKTDAFLAWVDSVESSGARLWNPPSVVRWNFEKTYLADLERKGIPVVPTVWLERGARADLAAILERERWPRAVVKPTVSLSAYETWIASREGGDEARLARMLERGGVMVQPFVEEIRTGGEWSLVFFGGEYSHAVVKRPAEGDFRSQSEYGATKTVTEPPARLVDDARRALEAAGGEVLYARVDGVDAGGLVLMELELIDPELYFLKVPAAAGRFAAALLETQNRPR
jgi:glutathione synthase/RimK-type ligase-like ATP-grasp enzyme